MQQLLNGSDNMEVNSIKSLGIIELEGIVAAYPWYSGARQQLLYKLAEMGEECFNHKLRDYASFVQNIDNVISSANTIIKNKREESLSEFIDLDILRGEYNTNQKIHVIGGDYFSSADFADLENIKIEKVGRYEAKEGDEPVLTHINQPLTMSEEEFNSPEFYTETLAQIFTQQGHYDKAIDVYAKLILLYPEKSAYFANLANEVKLKNK